MPEYYFDLETTGLTPLKDKIISVQYQQLTTETGAPLTELTILKEWESSEKMILETFLPFFIGDTPFSFLPIGQNTLFDLWFLRYRAKSVLGRDLKVDYLFHEKPFLDLKPILIILNRGHFRAYGNIIRTKERGDSVPACGSGVPR